MLRVGDVTGQVPVRKRVLEDERMRVAGGRHVARRLVAVVADCHVPPVWWQVVVRHHGHFLWLHPKPHC